MVLFFGWSTSAPLPSRCNDRSLRTSHPPKASVMTAFGLVIALSWKDAIKATVVYLMPNNDASTLYGVYVTAVSVTLLVTALAWIVMRVNRQIE